MPVPWQSYPFCDKITNSDSFVYLSNMSFHSVSLVYMPVFQGALENSAAVLEGEQAGVVA